MVRQDIYTLKICNNTVVPSQQWLKDRKSLLRYTYVGCIVIKCVNMTRRYLLEVHKNSSIIAVEYHNICKSLRQRTFTTKTASH